MSVLRFPKPKQIIVLFRNFCLSVVVKWTQGLSYSTNIVKIFKKPFIFGQNRCTKHNFEKPEKSILFLAKNPRFSKIYGVKIWKFGCIFIQVHNLNIKVWVALPYITMSIDIKLVEGWRLSRVRKKGDFPPIFFNATQPQQHKWFSWILYCKLQVSVLMHLKACI